MTPAHSHLKPKTVTQSPRNTTSPNSGKNTSAHTAPLTVTHPLIPSREGNPHAINRSSSKRTQLPNLPVPKRGRGCVTPEHSYLKIKSNHQKPTNATSPNSSKTISSQPAHLTVTHPSIPSQEGNPHTQPIHYQIEKQHPNLPS